MLRKLIGKIRRQPKQTRDNVALGVAATFTFLVAVIWLVSVPGSFGGQLSVGNSAETQTAGFFEQISDQAASVKEAFTAEDSATQSIKEMIEEYQKPDTTASSTQLTATSTATTTTPVPRPAPSQSAGSFTTDSTFEMQEPKEAHIQVVSKATTSTSTGQ